MAGFPRGPVAVIRNSAKKPEAALLSASGRQHFLYRGDAVIGQLVVESVKIDVDVSGQFIPGPDFEPCKSTFELATSAAERVESAPTVDYQQRWYEWRNACKAIDALELSFGERRAPIESFTVDSDWRVEFEIPLWWLVTVGDWGNAEPNTADDD